MMFYCAPASAPLWKKISKYVKFIYFFYLWVIIGFFNMTWNANHQGTLRNVHWQVNSFRNYLIRIFVIKAQFAILGYTTHFYYSKKIFFPTCWQHDSNFCDPKECSIYYDGHQAIQGTVFLETTIVYKHNLVVSSHLQATPIYSFYRQEIYLLDNRTVFSFLF